MSSISRLFFFFLPSVNLRGPLLRVKRSSKEIVQLSRKNSDETLISEEALN